MISRFLGKKSQAQEKIEHTRNLDDDILAAQTGDIHLRNQLLKEYQPFNPLIVLFICLS